MRASRHASLLALLALLTTVAVPATAQPAARAPDLYQDALQSIAEGRKTDASATLMRVIENEPNNAGAYLEVALIQCALGRSREAERLFAIIETRFEPKREILELISEARNSGCNNWQAMSAWTVSSGRGVDQNVNQGASNPIYIVERDGGQIERPLLSEFLPQHDQYSTLSADYMREITANGSVGFVQYQGRRNDSLRQFDSASLYVGIESPYRFGRWTVRTTGMLGQVLLGGNSYQRQLQLQARIGPPLPLPGSIQFNVMGGVTRTEYLQLTNFDSTLVELRGQFSYRKHDLYSSVSLAALSDMAHARRPGGSRRGLSLNTLVRHPLGQRLGGEMAYSYQGWDSSSPYAPQVIDEVRDQATHVLRGTVTYRLTKQHRLQLEARLLRNRENISIFQYNNRTLQLSWHWQGP